MSTKNTFNPDYVVHPGEILKETLKARSMSKQKLSKKCGISIKTINQIINKKNLINLKLALKLEKTLKVSSKVWINLSKNYLVIKKNKKK